MNTMARRWLRAWAAAIVCVALAGAVWAAPAPAALPAPAASASVPQTSGVWYEIFVRSWYDTDGDGIGDLDGVTAKLDYLKALGVDGIWLMPINPSPSYHGYDVTNYEAINPDYGDMAAFKRLLVAAHERGMRVIMDMVINHTSNEHPWFTAALAGNARYRNWYTWAGPFTDTRERNAFGGQAWQHQGDQAYLGIFAHTMPDLDYNNTAVRRQMIAIGRFWLKHGVDGFRLDAARHIYVDLAPDVGAPSAVGKNIAWWVQYRRGLNGVNPHAYLVGEVTRPEAAQLAPYLKAMDAVFNFPLAERLIKAAKTERNQSIAATLANTYATYRAASGDKRIKDAPFLSNHDQERVMSQLKGNRAHVRMAAAMLLTLPGEPYIYYGEELGMRGTKPDPALRTPMRWQRSTDARGEASWEKTAPANGAAVSVAAEMANPDSLLHYYTMLIHWRMAIPALRKGGFRVFPHAQDHVAAWQRLLAGKVVLVVHNLSSTAQAMPLGVPGEPHYGRIVKASRDGARIRDGVLHLPPYTSAVLE